MRYARVSTDDQTTAQQRAALTKAMMSDSSTAAAVTSGKIYGGDIECHIPLFVHGAVDLLEGRDLPGVGSQGKGA